MISTVIASKKRLLLSTIAAILFFLPGIASTQDNTEVPVTDSTAQEYSKTGSVYTPKDFERFAPRNALDMLLQVPGFTIRYNSQGRGLGQASMNVLINGQRLSSRKMPQTSSDG